MLYVEYEQTSGADKILKEVEGHDVESDFDDSNSELRQEHDHELELKLLLSSTFKGWNVAVNPIFDQKSFCRASHGSSPMPSVQAGRSR